MGDKRIQRIRVGSLTRKKHTTTDGQTDGRAGPARFASRPGLSPPPPRPSGSLELGGAAAKRALPRNTLQTAPAGGRRYLGAFPSSRLGTETEAGGKRPRHRRPAGHPTPHPAPASLFWRLRVTGEMPPVPPGSVGTPSLLLTSALLWRGRGRYAGLSGIVSLLFSPLV